MKTRYGLVLIILGLNTFNMNFTRATYDINTESVTVDGNTFEFGKYWHSGWGVIDSEGWWDNDNNNFIPDGFYDRATGWIEVV